MNMNRKQFLSLSGMGIIGLGFLDPLSHMFFGRSPMAKKSLGDIMIEVKTKRLELVHTWTISRNSSDYKDNVFVKLEHQGITGYGEAAPNVRYGENAQLTTQRIQEVRDIFSQIPLYHYNNIKSELDKRITDQSCAKAALDIALMDWIGKSFELPLYKMWGLDPSDAPVTSFSIGIDTVEVIKQKVKEAEPYPVLKIKVGTDRDEEIIGAVRSVTDKPIRVDANEGWKSKEEALEKIQWLKSQGIEFIEQPMPSTMLEETAWLRERVDIPVIADEAVKNAADIPKLATAYDGINIKLMKSGGLLEALRMIHMAKALNMKIMLGCMIESSVAISAAAQLAPFVDWADLDGNLLIGNDPFRGIKVEQGHLVYPEKPGLGVMGEF
ncbi:MAG: dipeptide epimerase [Calditrichaeota bacterium]|nr:dipeptide epimerase [Calditrichota bacterium]RQW02192.1 MAG: dipeptide epimerase [Calditrichota bacterium]